MASSARSMSGHSSSSAVGDGGCQRCDDDDDASASEADDDDCDEDDDDDECERFADDRANASGERSKRNMHSAVGRQLTTKSEATTTTAARLGEWVEKKKSVDDS